MTARKFAGMEIKWNCERIHDDTHFNFEVIDQCGHYWLDPWNIYWQMFKDQKTKR